MKITLQFIKNFSLRKKTYFKTLCFSTEKFAKYDINNLKKISKDEMTNSFYVSTPSKMVYTDKSLFTKQYIEQIKRIIGDAKDFKKITQHERNRITKELEDLYNLETIWKYMVRKTQHSNKIVQDLFPNGVEQFKKLYQEHFFPSSLEEDNKKVRKKYGIYKCAVFTQNFTNYLFENREIFSFLMTSFDHSVLTEYDFYCIVKSMDPKIIFCELVKISMKKTYTECVAIEKKDSFSFFNQEIDVNCLKARRTDLHYPISEFISLHIMTLVLDKLAILGALRNNGLEERSNYLKLIASHMKFYMEENEFYSKICTQWFSKKDEITYLLLQFLQRTEVISDVIKESKTIRSGLVAEVYVYIFNRKLKTDLAVSPAIPRLTPPKKAVTQMCVEDWITPVKNGEMKVKVSSYAMKALNIQQRKEFKVNTTFLNLVKERDTWESCFDMPTKQIHKNCYSEYERWMESPWFHNVNTILYNGTKQSVRSAESKIKVKAKPKKSKNKEKDSNISALSHSRIVQICSMVYGECHVASKKYEVHNKLAAIRTKRQVILTSLELCEVFENFPLYFSTLVDYRFRLYPLEHLLSRTSGFMKHLLEDYTPRTLTLKGLRHLLLAYFATEGEITKKLMAYTSSKFNKASLKSFFEKNKLSNIDNLPVYFALLETELKLIFSSTKLIKTSISVEIDQVGSGPSLVAILTGNRKLAQKCNLVPGDDQCVYSYIMSECKNYLFTEMPELAKSASVAVEFLSTDRKSQKQALMCYIYNQMHLSRTKTYKEHFEISYGRSVSDQEYSLISEFSKSYNNFIGTIFPMLDVQLDILEEAMQVFTSQEQFCEIETLDGCILGWDFGHYTTIKQNCWNPISRKADKISISVKSRINSKKTEFNRMRKHRNSFRPNLIHSLDSGLMRFFIVEYYNRTKHHLVSLHDCAIVHPNYVDELFDVILDAYCDPRMLTLAKDLVFKRFILNSTGEYRRKIQKLEKKFLDNMESLDYLNKDTFEPRRCYKFEGS